VSSRAATDAGDPDVFLGWHTVKKGDSTRHYYVRQLYDNKAAIAIDQLDESLLVTYGRICAWSLARAHARGGRGAEIAGYLGKSDVADEAFAASPWVPRSSIE